MNPWAKNHHGSKQKVWPSVEAPKCHQGPNLGPTCYSDLERVCCMVKDWGRMIFGPMTEARGKSSCFICWIWFPQLHQISEAASFRTSSWRYIIQTFMIIYDSWDSWDHVGVLAVFERCRPAIGFALGLLGLTSEAINWTNARVGLGSWEYIPGLMAGW